MSAYDLEYIICDQLSVLLSDQHFICETVPKVLLEIPAKIPAEMPAEIPPKTLPKISAEMLRQALANADLAAAKLRSGTAWDKALLLSKLVRRIDVQAAGVDLAVDRAALAQVLGLDPAALYPSENLMLTLPATKVRRGHQLRLIIPGPQVLSIAPATRDEKLGALIAEAHAARKLILAAPDQSIASIAACHGRCRTRLGKLAALSCLAPDIVTAIVEGRQPASLNARTLQDIDLPLGWPEQRALLSFA